MRITFLGGGNMASALIGGLKEKGFSAAGIQVIELNAEARDALTEKFGVRCTDHVDAASLNCEVLVLAVKPQQMREAVKPLVGKLGNQLVISIAAGLRVAGPPLHSVEDMARWLLALLDAAGVQRAVLAGHSMGSLIALEAAGRAPERATQLWMLGTAYPMKVSPALLQASLETPLAAIDMVVGWSISSLASKPSYPSPGVWLHGAYRALMRQVLHGEAAGGSPLFHTDFSACSAYAGAEAAATRVACPVHLVLGTADQMTQPRAAVGLAQMLKATVHRVPAGHSLMAEAPDAVLAALRQALGK